MIIPVGPAYSQLLYRLRKEGASCGHRPFYRFDSCP